MTKALWDSWEDDAVLLDKDSGYFANVSKVHRLMHSGKHFMVRGPLNVPRSPQGCPLIAQAGSSKEKKALAVAHADLHFTLVKDIQEAVAYRDVINAQLSDVGRAFDDFIVMPGILPVVAASASAAKEKLAYLESLVPDKIGVDLASRWCEVDLSVLPLDGPLPELPDDDTYNGQRTNLAKMKEFASQNLTIRETARRLISAGTAPTMSGTPSEISDQMEECLKSGAADGFNLMLPILPGDWIEFCEQVVPELQKRGLTQREYYSGTLRGKLGLARPRNQLAL